MVGDFNLTPGLEVKDTLLEGWLGGISAGLSDDFLQASRVRHLSDGQAVYNQGDEDRCLFGVASGFVRMFFTMNEQDPLLGHVVGPGFWFGEAGLILGQGRLMGAVASGPTDLWCLSEVSIDKIVQSNPQAWRAIAQLAVLNEALAIGAAEDLMIRDSRLRLAAVLLRLANLRNAFQRTLPLLEVPVTQPELAEAACLSRTVATDILRDFSQRGWVETGYRTKKIQTPAELTSILGS